MVWRAWKWARTHGSHSRSRYYWAFVALFWATSKKPLPSSVVSKRARAGFNGKMAENYSGRSQEAVWFHSLTNWSCTEGWRRTNSILSKISLNLTSVPIILSNSCIYIYIYMYIMKQTRFGKYNNSFNIYIRYMQIKLYKIV